MSAPFQALVSTGRIIGTGAPVVSGLARARLASIPKGLSRQRLYLGFYYDAEAAATLSTDHAVSIDVRFGRDGSERMQFGWEPEVSLLAGRPVVPFDQSAVVPPCAVEFLSSPPPTSPGVIPRIADEMLAACSRTGTGGTSGPAFLRMFPIEIQTDAAEIVAEFNYTMDADPRISFIGFLGLRGNV